MTKEFNDCLKRRKIIEFERAKGLVAKEIEQANEDLQSAQESFENDSYKWATIQAYYSMFHSARTLIYSRGYRERSHYCLIIAVRTLFVQEELLSYMLVEALQLGKTLRENADYYGEFSEDSAGQMIEDAGEFLKVARKLTR